MAYYCGVGDEITDPIIGACLPVTHGPIRISDEDEGAGTIEEMDARVTAFINSALNLPGTWKKCSFNGNIRVRYPGRPDGDRCYFYSPSRDAYIPPKPEGATGFNEETCNWVS